MMIRWTLRLALLALAAIVPARAEAPSPQALIAQCAQRTPPQARGLDALRSACPGIGRAVRALGLDAFLPARWQARVSARDLVDLAALADRYAGPPPVLRLDASRLKSEALSLRPAVRPTSWWELLTTWIERRLAPAGGGSNWLRLPSRSSVSPALRRALFDALVILTMLAAALLVLWELRSRGRWRAGPLARLAQRSSKRPESITGEAKLDVGGHAAVTPRDQLVLLLGALVQALSRTHRLEHERNLTCRELCTHARFDSARQREDFERIALLAERATYASPQGMGAALPVEVLSRARALLGELLAARPDTVTGAGHLRP
jgi:hypothetical protein